MNKPPVAIIPLKNSLKDRVSLQGESRADLSAADRAIDKLAKEFVKRLPDEFKRMEAAFSALRAKPDNDALRTVLFRLVHDLKGQAGTFDYQLISVIGNDLCRFLERPIALSPEVTMVIQFHLDGMKWVAKRRLTGDGDEEGQRMINILHSLTRKALHS